MQGDFLAWRVWPAERAPFKAAGLGIGCLAAGLVAFLAYGWVAALVAVGVLLASTADFWLGTNYRIDASGVSARTGWSPSSIGWEEIRTVHLGPLGVKVSPVEGETRPSPFRGVLLRYDEGHNVETVVTAVRARCKEDVRFLERGTEPGGDGGTD